MQDIAPQVVSIADACLGGLYGRSALLIGPQEQRSPYVTLLQRAGMAHIIQEDTPVSLHLAHVQLLISIPAPDAFEAAPTPMLTAANIAQGCNGRRTPLLIFDLAASTSVEEMAGLLPAVCLYTPDDVRRILLQVGTGTY